MDLDIGRKNDLQELSEARRTASTKDIRVINKTVDKIISESERIGGDRQKLIDAVRSGDERGARYMREQIDNKNKDMYGGRYDR